MNKFLVLVALMSVFTLKAIADDGDTKEKVKVDEKAKVEEPKKEEPKKEDKSDKKEEHGGNCLTRFWVHTVGGTIGGGLKTGADKINHGI